MTDDQTAATVPMMPQLNALIGERGDELRAGDRELPALLPVARHQPHRPVRAQPRRAPQQRALRRLPDARPHEHAARLAAGRRLPDDARRALPERLPVQRRDPGGLHRLVRKPARERLQLHDLEGQRERRAALLSAARATRRLPDRPVHAARRRPDRGRRAVGAALLPVALVRRAAPRRPARPGRPAQPRHALPRSAPPRRLRGLLDAAPAELQRAVDVRQAAGGGRPPALHAREGRGHRGELAPGAREPARGRRGRGAGDRRAAPQRRAREHADRLHVRQRLHARRAPGTRREGAALRAVDPRPAPDARPGHPARARRRAAGGEPRRSGHDPRRRARDAVAPARRALAARPRRGPRRGVGPRHPDRERARRERHPHLPRHPQLPLPVRRAPHDRRVRALRPGRGPLPAEQQGRRRSLRRGAARPEAAAARAAHLRGRELPGRPAPAALPALAGPADLELHPRRPARARRRLGARRHHERRRARRPAAASAARSPRRWSRTSRCGNCARAGASACACAPRRSTAAG